MSLDGVIDAPTWTFDYGYDPKMGEAIAASMDGCTGDVRTSLVAADHRRRSRSAEGILDTLSLLVRLHALQDDGEQPCREREQGACEQPLDDGTAKSQ